MATVPNPRTWTVGEVLTASKLNTDLRDGLAFLLTPPQADIYRTTSLNITNNTITDIPWDGETVDTDGGHSTVSNTTRYTVQTAGWWHVVSSINWVVDGNTTGYRQHLLSKNASPFLAYDMRTPLSDSSCVGNINAVVFLNVSDYLEVKVLQNSGGTRSLNGSTVNPPGGTHAYFCWRSK